jgi:carotenoid cleavage dioxygenase-like enzyme
MYVEAEIDPFKIMDRAWLLDPKRAPHHVGARLRRYYIDLETKEITFNDMLKRDTDTLGFVEYNPRFAAKETRYTYIVSLDYNENKTMLHQYDSKTGTDKTWSEDDIYLSEPQVIVDPDNHGELDMLIVFSIYDHKIENNRMVIIDCNTLEPISDTVMPTRLPMTLHQYWYAAN